jgi:hypothetical protein
MLTLALLPSFSDELVKIARSMVDPREKADEHFEQQVKDWGAFEKNLKAKSFQKAILEHPEADTKLKRYVKNFGAYLNSKDVVGRMASHSKFRHYIVKRLPSGRLACNCKDWQFVRSVGQTDCKHIAELKANRLAS